MQPECCFVLETNSSLETLYISSTRTDCVPHHPCQGNLPCGHLFVRICIVTPNRNLVNIQRISILQSRYKIQFEFLYLEKKSKPIDGQSKNVYLQRIHPQQCTEKSLASLLQPTLQMLSSRMELDVLKSASKHTQYQTPPERVYVQLYFQLVSTDEPTVALCVTNSIRSPIEMRSKTCTWRP